MKENILRNGFIGSAIGIVLFVVHLLLCFTDKSSAISIFVSDVFWVILVPAEWFFDIIVDLQFANMHNWLLAYSLFVIWLGIFGFVLANAICLLLYIFTAKSFSQQNEVEETAAPEQPLKARKNILSIMTVVAGFLTLLCILTELPKKLDLRYANLETWTRVNVNSILITTILGLLSVVLGSLALFQINKYREKFSGKKPAVIGMFAAVLSMVLSIYVICPYPRKTICKANLRSLVVNMQFYVNKYKKYPPANTWCDSITIKGAEKQFICPSGKHGRCHYALNSKASPNSASNVVLLFETNAGWNQFGGKEILTLANHNGKGCHVLFNDLTVEFVKAEDIEKLHWN